MVERVVGGRIVRLKLKGFMTYDELELHPHKGLNLIIGLNGSGKSSIMAAICLGLGGKPQFTGRTVQLSEFIKYNHTTASVEIELESPHGQNDVIRRVIQREKPLWYLNKKIVNQNEIMSVINKYNIDMGNLCQFLPQEKVSEFSKMDKKQRLVNMIQAIGDPKLVTLFDELKKLRIEFNKFEKMVEDLENSKASEEKLNERLQPEINKYEERMTLISEMKVLKIQKMICNFEILRQQVDELATEIKTLKSKSSRKELRSVELNNEKDSHSTKFSSYKKKVEETKAEIFKCMEKLTKCNHSLSVYHEEVDNAKIYFENRMQEKKDQNAKLNALNMQIQGLREAQAQLNQDDEAKLKEKLKQNEISYENVKNNLSVCYSDMEKLTLHQNQMEYAKKSKDAEIAKISNEEDKKYEVLHQKYPDAYAALNWLQKNQNSFRARVWPPPLVSIQVKDDNYLKYIESTVSSRDLLMFVCEDKGDLERFVKIMKYEKKLAVNVSMVPDKSLDAFQYRPVTNEMRSFGIECYLKNLFTAPDPVMRYLCQLCRVHQVPICNSHAERNIDSILNYSTLFFTASERISGKRSLYGQKSLSVKRESLRSRNILPNIKDNTAALLSAKNELQEILRELNNHKVKRIGMEEQRTKLERDQEQLRLEKQKINVEMVKWNDFEIKLNQLTVTYNRKKKELVDEAEEKRKLVNTIQDKNSKQLETLSDIHKIVKEIVLKKKEKANLLLQMKAVGEKMSSLRDQIKKLEDEIRSIQSRQDVLISERSRVKSEAFEIRTELAKNEEDARPLVMGIKKDDLETIEEKISNINAQLELNNEDISDVLAEFNTRKERIITIEKDVTSHQKKIEDLNIRIEEKRELWLPKLVTHIESVNTKFSEYYMKLDCAGEICLDQTADIDDFPNYGLNLKLQYRADEGFKELSQSHHSGGECSVAAIIFILSLQELTNVPFRCIDEINQGMDARNERNIYKLIADAAKSGSCSQYFLLTPKLLMDLSYHNDVAVHTIFNSTYLQAKLNVKEHLRIAKSSRR